MIGRNRPYDEFVRGDRRGLRRVAGGRRRSTGSGRCATTSCTSRSPTPPRSSSACGSSAPSATTTPTSAGARTTTTAWPASSRRLGRKSFGEPPPYYAARHADDRRGQPADRQAHRAEAARRPRARSSRPSDDPRHAAGRLDGPARQPVLRQGARQPHVGPLPRPRAWSTRWTTCARRTRRPTPSCSTRWPRDFVEHKFDVKHVIRTICNSRIYQLSSEPTDDERARPAELRPLLRPAADRRGVPRRGRPGDRHARPSSARCPNRPGRWTCRTRASARTSSTSSTARTRARLRVRPERRREPARRCCTWPTRRDRGQDRLDNGRVARLVKAEDPPTNGRRGAVPRGLRAASRRPSRAGAGARARGHAGRSRAGCWKTCSGRAQQQRVHVQPLSQPTSQAPPAFHGGGTPMLGRATGRRDYAIAATASTPRARFLKVGTLGLAGLTLADLLRLRPPRPARRAAAERHRGDLLWLGGGPSHIDMYDLKPDAPAEFRGEFKPIATNVPGRRRSASTCRCRPGSWTRWRSSAR